MSKKIYGRPVVTPINPDKFAQGGGGSGGITTTEKALILSLFRNAAYTSADMGNILTQLETLWSGGEVEPDEPDVPVVPDEPEKTLTSISAVYAGGDVAVGTAVSELTGIAVTAHYSDGTSEAVTGYTLSGTIAEGINTITVSYGGKTTTFTVTGAAESGGGESGNDPFAGKWTEGFRLEPTGTEYPTGHANYDTTDYVECSGFNTITISATVTSNTQIRAVVWYDTNKTRIDGAESKYISSNSTTYPVSVDYTKPEGAVYCRICIVGHENTIISVV